MGRVATLPTRWMVLKQLIHREGERALMGCNPTDSVDGTETEAQPELLEQIRQLQPYRLGGWY